MNILNRISVIDIVTIFLYFLIMILIGLRASRKIKGSRDFTTAGQSLTWKTAAGSTIATCMGANMVMGKYDLIFESGMAGLTASLFWWLGWIFLLIMTKRLRASKATSIPAFLEQRYNKTTRKLCSLCVLIAMVSSCAAQFLTIGTILETFGLCDRTTGTWIGAGVVVVFTILSGLWGVTLTDSMQSVLLMIAFGVVFPVVVFKVAGGWDAVIEFNGPERLSMFSGIAPVTMFGWAVYYTLSTGAEPTYAQRIFSAKSTKDAVIGQSVAWGGNAGHLRIPVSASRTCNTADFSGNYGRKPVYAYIYCNISSCCGPGINACRAARADAYLGRQLSSAPCINSNR